MNLSTHLLCYEETPEYIYSLFDYITHDVKKLNLPTCAIDVVLTRMGVLNAATCCRRVRPSRGVCKKCALLKHTIADNILKSIDGEGSHIYPRNPIYTYKYKIIIESIPPITTLNKYDPRCGRVPLARDIITMKPSLGLYRSCDRLKKNSLGCHKHYCRRCFAAELASFYTFLCCARELPTLPYDLYKYIRVLSQQRVKVNTYICYYTNKKQMLAAAIYNDCPRKLQSCKHKKSGCIQYFIGTIGCDVCKLSIIGNKLLDL